MRKKINTIHSYLVVLIGLALLAFHAEAKTGLQSIPKPLISIDDLYVKYTTDKNKNKDKKFEADKYIPLDLTPTDDGSQVFVKVADKTVNTLFNDPDIKNSFIGRTADNVQKKMQTDVTVKSSEPEGVDHNFRLNFLAFQNQANIDYSGYLNASLKYKTSEPWMNFEVYQKIAGDKDLVFSKLKTSGDDLDQISLRWNF